MDGLAAAAAPHRLDAAVLRVIRQGDADAWFALAEACDACGAHSAEGQRGLWQLARAACRVLAGPIAPAESDTSVATAQRLSLQLLLHARPHAGKPVQPDAIQAWLALALAVRGGAGWADATAAADEAAPGFWQQAETESQQLVAALEAWAQTLRMDASNASWDATARQTVEAAMAAVLETAIDLADALSWGCQRAGLSDVYALIASIEQALLWLRHRAPPRADAGALASATALVAAAEEVRAMLHRHAAGFARPPSEAALEGLQHLLTEARAQLGLPG